MDARGDVESAAPSLHQSELKRAALASVVHFLVQHASLPPSTASASVPPSLPSRLSSYQRLGQSELQGMDLGDLEAVMTGLIEHRLLPLHILNALSLVHFIRVAHRKEGDSWSAVEETAETQPSEGERSEGSG